MLAGNTWEGAANARTTGPVAALAGNNVGVPIAAFGKLLTPRQQRFVGLIAALPRRYRHLAIVFGNIGYLLIVEHIGKRHHGRILTLPGFKVVQLLSDIVRIQPR